MNLQSQDISFNNSTDQVSKMTIDSRENTKSYKDPIAAGQNSAEDQNNQKAKEGILLAALVVLAGSTGIGHFLHH